MGRRKGESSGPKAWSGDQLLWTVSVTVGRRQKNRSKKITQEMGKAKKEETQPFYSLSLYGTDETCKYTEICKRKRGNAYLSMYGTKLLLFIHLYRTNIMKYGNIFVSQIY